MLSDNQHIDDFFRQKEEAFAPDNLPVEANWQQFKTQLSKPGGDPGKGSPGNTHITRLLGLIVVAAVVLLIAINPFKHSKKKITATTKQQTTVAVRDTPAASKPDVKVAADAPAQVIVTRPAANKHAHEQSPILISAIPAAPVTANKGNDTVESASPDATEMLQSFFQQLEKPATEFYINTDRDTILVTAAGTRLVIPAHTLLNKTGAVKITVREYYKYEDIIAAKLTTTSNGEQLITGGMVHISAEQDGQPVTIAPQKAITVNMPTNNYDDSMQLFAGQEVPRDDQNITDLNWLPLGPFIQKINDHSAPKGYELNLDKVEPYAVNYGKNTTAKFYVSRYLTIAKTELTDRLKQRFGSYYDVIKIKRAPKWSYRDRLHVIDSIPVGDIITFSSTYTTTGNIRLSKENGLTQDSSFNAQQQKLYGVYSFALNKFGWYNCDRFLKDRRAKVDCTVLLDKGATAANHVCFLVFTRYKSLVQGDYWRGQKQSFPQVPAGESAIVVTVAVNAGKVVSSMQPVTISATPITDLTFTPTTPEQFKQQLQSLLSSQKQ